jgi:nucleoid-associated protein YgaU
MLAYFKATIRKEQLKLIIAGLALIAFYLLSLIIFSNSIQPSNFTYEQVTVQKGDTLWGLAAKSNDDVDTNTLVSRTIKYNNLKSTYIQPGQVIYVPVRL